MKPPLQTLVTTAAAFLHALDDYLGTLSAQAPASPEAASQPEAPNGGTAGPEPVEGKPKRKGRGPAAPKEPVNPALNVDVNRPNPALAGKAPEPVQPSDEEITVDSLRALFRPLITKENKGQAIKDALAKYDNCESIVNLDPKHYPAFKADIEALLGK